MVLLSEENYVKDVKRQLSNSVVYLRLQQSPFPILVDELNYKLTMAQEKGLINNK